MIERNLQGKFKVTTRRERRRTQLLDDLEVNRRYWNLKEEALGRTVWRTRFWKRLWTCCKADCRIIK